MTNNIMYKTPALIVFLLCGMILTSCKSSENKDDKTESPSQSIISETEQTRSVKKIFYNIPTPLEITNIIEHESLVYAAEILNPVQNENSYFTNYSVAINLGIYGADLCYSRMFDQIQQTIIYLSTLKRLTLKLGIPQTEEIFAINRAEENLYDKDSLLQIVSDIYSTSDMYLKQNNNGHLAALVILGGWIETLFLATHLNHKKIPGKELLTRIAEQKISFHNLLSFLSIYKKDTIIASYIESMERIKKIYETIEVKTVNEKPMTDAENNMTVIVGKNIISISEEQFLKLYIASEEIRNSMIR